MARAVPFQFNSEQKSMRVKQRVESIDVTCTAVQKHTHIVSYAFAHSALVAEYNELQPEFRARFEVDGFGV